MTANDQENEPTTLSRWLRVALVVLALLAICGFNVFANPLGLAVDGDAMNEELQMLILTVGVGVMLAEPILLTVWMMLADIAPGKRISLGLLILMLIVASHAYGIFIIENRVNNEVLGFPLVVAFLAAAMLVPLNLLRRFTGWRIQGSAQQPTSSRASAQFGIRAILFWTLEVGLLAGMFQFLFHRLPEEERHSWGAGQIAVMALVGLLLSLPVIAVAWMFLGRGRVKWVGALMTVLAIGVSAGIAIGVSFLSGDGETLENLVQAGAVTFGMLVASTFVYLTFRGLGYRMAWAPNVVSAVDSNADQAMHDRRESRAGYRLGWQFAAAMLMVVAVCLSVGWRAKQIIPQRLRDAEQAYLRDLGFSVQLEGNTIVGLGPINDTQRFDEAHVEAISALDPVPTLNLAAVTDPSGHLAVLRHVRNARSLFLYHSGATDADLALVGKMPTLEVLNISNTKVTDAGIAELATLKNLQQLVASSTAITDAGLAHLHGLKSLTVVELYSTGVTAEGVKKLQEAVPKVSVRWQ